jgi:poly(3-hydroxybutyrate) depolymerase
MKAFALSAIALAAVSVCLVPIVAQQQPPAQAPPQKKGGGRGAPFLAKPEDLAAIKEKSEQIEAAVKELKAKRADADLVGDVEVYAHAGRMLLEFPELVANQGAITNALAVMDQGIERAGQLKNGQSPWNSGKKQVHAYYSAMDGSVQPYAITLPDNYDAAKPARLYVWLHGRQNNTIETEFIRSQQTYRAGNPAVADQGQIQVDLFGRINSAGWHWAGEADVFEGIAAVEKRFKIDERRILLRGFSMGGEGAWHIALHYPDRFAAAEIGAGTWSRRGQMPGLEPYQYPVLRIWENMEDWALNAFNLPLAGHDGDADTQIPYLPGPAPAPNRGQLESSLRARAQLEKEGFAAEGEPDFYRMKGTPDIFLISQNTGHGTSALVRQRLDAFLKEWGDKGQSSPQHVRFLTYTTRYNRDYWVTVDEMEKLYDRADVDAQRDDARAVYDIKTHNVARLALAEMERAREIKIDGQDLKVKPGAAITLWKTGAGWKTDRNGPQAGLHKTHALQGPIDDAFVDPFLLVRPTGAPWNAEVNAQALRTLERFDRLWAKFFRGHPFVKDDKDVTPADLAKYHVVLFGDPGSNRLMAKMLAKLPVKWTRDEVAMGAKSYPAKESFPALVYPNPLNPAKYVVLNTGLTIPEREYNGDYGMPLWGDYAIVKATESGDVGEMQTAGLFDESWKITK